MNQIRQTKILGVGGYVPENKITNFDLEKMMDTTNDWIVQRTGIETRYWANDETSTSDLALEASLEAIKNSSIKKEDIDFILVSSCSGDADFPGVSCFLQAKLGLATIPALEIKQQCSGFVYGLTLADSLIKSGLYNNILLVGAELQSKGLDKTSRGRNTSVLFGDGAGAFVLTGHTEADGPRIIASDLHADGNFAEELWIPAPGCGLGPSRMTQEIFDQGLHFPVMNGKTVFVHAVKRMSETVREVLSKSGMSIQDIDLFLFHQANLRINQKVGEMLELKDEQVHNTVQKFGNTTAATIPLGFKDAMEAGKIKRGQKMIFAAFGSGFTWGSVLLEY